MSPKLSYANVVSTLCLFLLLGGGAAYARSHLAKNSVGTPQIKKNAVSAAKIKKNSISSAKVKNGSLRAADFKAGQFPQGPQGPPGQNLTATTPLASGATESGAFAAAGGEDDTYSVVASFAQPLPAPLDKNHVVTLQEVEASHEHCPGVGQADPGYFCAYIGYTQSAEVFTNFENPETGLGGASRFGTNAFAKTTGIAGAVSGTWSVTAP
jgi:hypothetical protein